MSNDRKPLEDELADLEDALQNAINVEDYNLAAKIRDRVNEITDFLVAAAMNADQETVSKETQLLEEEKLKCAELYTQLQRKSADFSNFQKRTKKDKERWIRDSTRQVLTSFLPALDNLDSVINSLVKTEGNDSLKTGLALVGEAFQESFKKFNISKILPEIDDVFNPELHKAISIQHDESAKVEAIAYVSRPGYKIDDAVIRPADVVVKKHVPQK